MSFTANSTGGKYKINLSTNNIPAHKHNFLYDISGREAFGYGLSSGQVAFSDRVIIDMKNKNWINNVPISSSGGGQSHDNIQPYYVVYLWKRTA